MWKSLILSTLLLLLSLSLCRGDKATDAKTRSKYPRRLDSRGQRFVNEHEFNAWHWPPKRPEKGKTGNNVDYKYDANGDKQWFEDYDNAVKEYVTIRKKIEEVDEAVELLQRKTKAKLYRAPTRAYPLCVDGFKPLLHELEDPAVWAKSQHDMTNPKYNYVMDEFYHWMPIFAMLSPRDGVYNQGWNVNLMNPPSEPGKIAHRLSAEDATGPLIIHCKRHFLESPSAETVQTHIRFPHEETFEGTSWTPRKSPGQLDVEKYKYLPNWLHIYCQTFRDFRLEGLLIQAVSFPNGLPFGKFVDTHNCHNEEIHEYKSNDGDNKFKHHLPDVTCYKDVKTFDWVEGTPKKNKRIRNVIPCKYNHGNNNGGFHPTVWAFGGNRWTIPKPKYGIFRTLFTYTSAHCNHKVRMNFIVIAVSSFINAIFEVYVSASVPIIPHDKSFSTPPLLSTWNQRMSHGERENQFILRCRQWAMQPEFEEVGESFGSTVHSPNSDTNKFGWEEQHLQFRSDLGFVWKPWQSFLIYDRDYDDCIRDTTNSLGLLDEQRNCPPKNLCLNLEHKDAFWDKDEKRKDMPDYYNPVSIHRFDKYWITKATTPAFLRPFIYDACSLKRCIHPKFTIPIMKVFEEWEHPTSYFCSQFHFSDPKNRGRRRRRRRALTLPHSQNGSHSQSIQLRQEQGGPELEEDFVADENLTQLAQGDVDHGQNPFARPHRFSEELTRGSYLSYNYFIKKSIITHSWMMVFAWFILLTIGIFTSRYYKETGGIGPFGENAVMGVGAWIWVHVMLLLLSMCFMWMGVLEVAHYRQKPPSCNMFEAFHDLSLKNYCRWRKQSVRLHQWIGYASLILFHVSFFLSWTRPVKVLNLRFVQLNLRKIFIYIHVISGYAGKLLAVISVMAFWDRRAFSVCKDIPILVIIMELVSVAFFFIGWAVQTCEDRRRPIDEDNRYEKKCCPVLEAVDGEDVPWYGCKVALIVTSLIVHLALFMIVCLSLDMVFGKDGEGKDDQGGFEIRKGIFGTCNVTSRDSVMRAMIARYYQLDAS